MDTFETLAGSVAERDALERLRAATGGPDGPMERHCLRVRLIAAALGVKQGWALDGELLTVAAILHDIGIYPSVSDAGVYTAQGAALARELLAGHGWSQERIERCADAIDRHHELRPQLARGAEVEAIRRADLVDVSGGILAFGLDHGWLRELARRVPRRGFARELMRLVSHALRTRPLTMLQIFRRP